MKTRGTGRVQIPQQSDCLWYMWKFRLGFDLSIIFEYFRKVNCFVNELKNTKHTHTHTQTHT